MSANVFVDTNIFIYCFDDRDKKKQKKAILLVKEWLVSGRGRVSFQVIQEFCNVASRKFSICLSADMLHAYLDEVLLPLCEVWSSVHLYKRALSLQADTKYSFYDSLVVAAALESRCQILYSEDLQHGQKIETLTILDPFR